MSLLNFFKVRPPDISSLKDKKDIFGLINALNFKKDSSIRQSAANALSSLSAIEAIKPLVKAVFKDEDNNVKKAELYALGMICLAKNREPDKALKSWTPTQKELMRTRQEAREVKGAAKELAVLLLESNSNYQALLETIAVVIKDEGGNKIARRVIAATLNELVATNKKEINPIISTLVDYASDGVVADQIASIFENQLNISSTKISNEDLQKIVQLEGIGAVV